MSNIYETAKEMYEMFTKLKLRELYVNATDPEYLRIGRLSWNNEHSFVIFNNIQSTDKNREINLIVKDINRKI
jgi:hypothetical protein